MVTSKSPWDVAMVALAAGKDAFGDYSHKFSPHKFTQPQLFACLVLKEFERKDYRGVARLLADWSELRQALGLRSVPHFTTLQKASRRLLELRHIRPLIARTVRLIQRPSGRGAAERLSRERGSGSGRRHPCRPAQQRADAADPQRARWNQQAVTSGQIAAEYGLVDADGTRPDVWRYIDEVLETGRDGALEDYRWP